MTTERSTYAQPIAFPLPLREGQTYPLDFDVHYLITVPDGAPQDASPMQGFAPSLCRHSGLVRAAASLPSTIYDLTPPGLDTLLARRMAGSHPVNWHCQTPRAVRFYLPPPMVPFQVIMINPEDDAADYINWAALCIVPPIVVAKAGGEIGFEELSAEKLRQMFLVRCDLLPGTIDPASAAEAKQMLSSWDTARHRELGYKVGGHNSVSPNLMALASAGYVDCSYGPFTNVGSGTKPYVDQIVSTANSILDERHTVSDCDMHRMFHPTMDVSLFAPSIYPHLLDMQMPREMEHSERKRFEQVIQALRRQDGYGFDMRNWRQSQAFFGIDSKTELDAGKQPRPHPLLHIRAGELSLATEAMGALAVSEFSAVVRLPNDVNRSAGLVRTFAQQYRGNSPNSRKRLLAFRDVQKRLARAVPSELIDVVRRSQSGVRVVADAHLEWLDIDGLPLGIRHNVARIPTTPGNLFIGLLGPQDHLRLTPDDLAHVLIVCALKREDPIREMFEIAFGVFGRTWQDRIRIDFVDVANEEEFVAAVNNFAGNVVIFDGHGAHADGAAAALYLQDTAVDVWSLREKITRMPPIVVLSACDTHAADRNHATAANGFIALGARAVLASVFPLYAPTAATFAARLVYRLADFVGPAIRMFDRAFTWAEVVSGMIRMHLLTDFLHHLKASNRIDEAMYLEVHLLGNEAINTDENDPFECVINALITRGLEQSLVRRELELVIANSSAISYLHVGRPETILIDDIERASEQFKSYQPSDA